MSGITLSDAQAQLSAWLEASIAVSKGASYRIADRELRRADLDHVQAQIKFWQAQCYQLTRQQTGGAQIRIGQVSSND